MKRPFREKLIRRGRIATALCRYAGAIVLTYTFTMVLSIKEEFEHSVELPLRTAVRGSLEDITSVRETMTVVYWRLANGDGAEEMKKSLEKDRDLIEWAERVKAVAVYAVELDRAALQVESREPMKAPANESSPTTKSYSPFDSFYGSTASEGPSEIKHEMPETSARKPAAYRNAEAIAVWNEEMKESGKGLLEIPERATLYPYQHDVRVFMWVGCGLLVLGTLPLLWVKMIGKT
jgi:hypothetical protein